MPKYAFLYFGDDTAEVTAAERAAISAAIFKWFDENHRKGRFVDGGEELAARGSATSVRRTGATTKVTDGPFVETKEGVGGYSVIEAKDMDDAIELAKTWPGQGVEIRPIREG